MKNRLLDASRTNYILKYTHWSKVGLSFLTFSEVHASRRLPFPESNNGHNSTMNSDSLKLTRLLSCSVQLVLRFCYHTLCIVWKQGTFPIQQWMQTNSWKMDVFPYISPDISYIRANVGEYVQLSGFSQGYIITLCGWLGSKHQLTNNFHTLALI